VNHTDILLITIIDKYTSIVFMVYCFYGIVSKSGIGYPGFYGRYGREDRDNQVEQTQGTDSRLSRAQDLFKKRKLVHE